MKGRFLMAMASLAMLTVPLQADPGGQPNHNARKKRGSQVEAGQQRADNVKIIAVGGHRLESQWQAGEKWRADKQQAHRDEKALRAREAQERLAREETKRAEARARQDREKLAAQERRDAEKQRRIDAARAKADEAKRDKAADRQVRR